MCAKMLFIDDVNLLVVMLFSDVIFFPYISCTVFVFVVIVSIANAAIVFADAAALLCLYDSVGFTVGSANVDVVAVVLSAVGSNIC